MPRSRLTNSVARAAHKNRASICTRDVPHPRRRTTAIGAEDTIHMQPQAVLVSFQALAANTPLTCYRREPPTPPAPLPALPWHSGRSCREAQRAGEIPTAMPDGNPL